MPPSKTLVIGIGEVGGALAEVLEGRRTVIRLDLEPIQITDPIDVVHVCLPFTSTGQFIATVTDYIRRFRPRLTFIHSTVLPGTTRAVAQATGQAVVYSPVRGKHFRMVADLMRYTKFIAGLDQAGLQAGKEYLEEAGFEVRHLDRPETLELAKLAETSYFGLQIAFAQELNRYAEALRVDYEGATALFEQVNFLPQCRYFPGFIGGHCVMPNIKLLSQIRRSPLLEAIVESNNSRARELELERSAVDAPGNSAGGKMVAKP